MLSLLIVSQRFTTLSVRSFSSTARLRSMADSSNIVTVQQGALRGSVTTSAATGSSYFSVKGVPYAKPPLGPLRFKAPAPLEPWTGIRDALTEGNVCPHIDPMLEEYIGDEDCLFVNVYTPQLPGKDGSGVTNRAVMVFIHGGGFTMGSGNSAIYGPDHLVDQGVVLVTFNYRLGAFGFMSTDDGEIPGNLGLKDQVAALRWVQENIAKFGGDPGNVTIFGESAGGASVHYHVLSPMSKGLFHRAISQSGSALNSWAFSKIARTRTVRLAQGLGCKSTASKDIVAFLRKVPAKQLVDDLLLSLSVEEKRRLGDLTLPFVPVSERLVNTSEEKFLPADPIDIIKSGKFNMVPYITGFNSNEGLLFLKGLQGNDRALKKLDNDFESLLPVNMFPQIDTPLSREAASKLKKYFFGDKPLCEDTLENYAKLKADTLFVYNIDKTVRLHASISSAPLYYYHFTFDGDLGLFKKYVLNSDIPGVAHADDLGYLFHISINPFELDKNSPAMKMLTTMVQMWTNFAKTGNPNPGTTWEPVTPTKQCCLRIDERPTMVMDVEKEGIDFWDKLYDTYTNKVKSNL